MVSWRSDRAGQGLIPKLFWPGTLDCKTAFGRSFLIAAIEQGRSWITPGPSGMPDHNNGPDDCASGPSKIIRRGYIRRACRSLMPLITASDLAQTVARLRHRDDIILPES